MFKNIETEGIFNTAIVGLMGTGRWYMNDLVRSHPQLGPFFFDGLSQHGAARGASPIICSGHATQLYASAGQMVPVDTTTMLLEPSVVGERSIVFVFRHPVDSLITNWIWWRKFLADGSMSGVVSNEFGRDTRALAQDIDRNLDQFLRFCTEGVATDRQSAASAPFLTFNQFVDETVNWIRTPSVVSIRLEDFYSEQARVDAHRRMLSAMGRDLSIPRIPPPQTMKYRFIEVFERCPRVRDAIESTLTDTAKRSLTLLEYQV